MRFKLDENLPPSAAELLRGLGHDVTTVYDQGLQSCSDPEVLAACQDEGRVLFSLDLDFSNIVLFPPKRYAGLIVLRMREPGPKALLRLMRRILPHLESVEVAGRLWIADEHRIRVRLVAEIDLGPQLGEIPYS